MDRKIKSLIYKTVLVLLSLLVVYNYIINFNGNTLGYFTILSNIFVFIVMLIIWIKTFKDVVIKKEYDGYNTYLLYIKGSAMLCITVTFLVFAFMLADYKSINNYSVQNLSEHYIIPIMMILDYFLFDEKGKIKWFYPFIWVLIAMMYLPYIFIRAAIIKPESGLIRYPYFFLNVDKLGVGGVVLWCIGLIIFFSLVVGILFLYDKKKSNK